jgi:sugar lactone lactonase YvrE
VKIVRKTLVAAVAVSLTVTCAALAGATATTGTITTRVELGHPRGLAVLPDGEFLVAQPLDNVVRRVAIDGTSTIVAGTGEPGYSGDGGPAALARLSFVHGVALLPGGGFVLADTRNDAIRKVATDGTISTVAGVGSAGFAGDGGPATAARLWAPHGVSVTADGGMLIADTENHRIRRVATDGTITTVAGNGERGYSGDDGPATAARLDRPFDVASLPGGGFLIADANRVRRVGVDGRIKSVAGNAEAGYAGDGGPAILARLSSPHGVAPLPDGGFLIADTGNQRIRRVRPDGTITTVAGTGEPGFSGDGGPAVAARLDLPKAVAVALEARGYLIGDAANNRVRLVETDVRTLLVVKIPPTVRSKSGQAAQLPVALSDGASLRLEVRRGSKNVLTLEASRPAGSSRLFFGRKLRAGTYALRLGAIAADGRRATTTGRLLVRP